MVGRTFSLALFLAGATNALAGALHVPSDYSAIQDAIDAALPGDKVIVHPGIYTEFDISFAGKAIEVSGIDILPGNKVAIASRRGDIFVGEGVFGEDPDPKWTLFARGLHEVIGIAWKDGWLYLTQRPEVSRIKDSDGDGRADVFETMGDGWGINGDYHEYAFGTRHDKNGDIWVVLCLTGSGGADDKSHFRGWCMRVTPDGKTIPTGYGIRSPGGIGLNHLGDVFYCDNQGLWNGSSSLKHLRPGGFQGNPTGNKFFALTDVLGPKPPDPKSGSRIEIERKRVPDLVPPPIVLPHGKMGNSPSRHRVRRDRWQVRSFQEPALYLRADPLQDTPHLSREGEWLLPRGCIPLSQGLWLRQHRGTLCGRRQYVHRWHQSWLGIPRQETVFLSAGELDRQGAVRGA